MGTQIPPCSAVSGNCTLCFCSEVSKNSTQEAASCLNPPRLWDPPFGDMVRFILHRFKSTQSPTAAQCLVLYSPRVHTELISRTCHSRGRQHLCHQPGAVWPCSVIIHCPSVQTPHCRGRESLSHFCRWRMPLAGTITGTDRPEEIWDEQKTTLLVRCISDTSDGVCRISPFTL